MEQKDWRVRLLYTQDQIAAEVRKLAADIDNYYQPDVMLCTLSGATLFFSDLIRALPSANFEIDFIRSKSYALNQQAIKCEVSGPVAGTCLKHKRVVVVEDIIDTGHTMRAIWDYLQPFECKSITFVSLLKRKSCHVNVGSMMDAAIGWSLRWGLEVEDGWLVGYGMDSNGKQRNLPNIYVL